MKPKHTIRYLPVASDDLLSIADWIAVDNLSMAEKFVDKLDRRIKQLEHHPYLGKTPRHDKLRNQGYRVLILDSYLIFYKVIGNTIEIHRVIHASRNLDELI